MRPCVALGVACALLLGSVGSANAAIPQSARYDVQLQGNVNGIPFVRTGVMAIGPTVTAATSNGINALDVCLASGSPFISPELGAIWFSTNGICINANGARQDMALVTADGQASTLAIRPDPAISATGINGFNQSSGLTAAVWQIFDGAMAIQFQGNGETITGAIDFLGTGAIFHSEQRYTATLTGRATALVPAAAPPADVGGAPVAPPTIAIRAARPRVNRKRLAHVASLTCPAATCTITAPRTARLRLAGKRYTVAVLAPATLQAGETARVRIRLPRAAFRRLAGRRAKVRFKLSIAAGDQLVSRLVNVKIARG